VKHFLVIAEVSGQQQIHFMEAESAEDGINKMSEQGEIIKGTEYNFIDVTGLVTVETPL
jgi:hypothetical protein